MNKIPIRKNTKEKVQRKNYKYLDNQLPHSILTQVNPTYNGKEINFQITVLE